MPRSIANLVARLALSAAGLAVLAPPTAPVSAQPAQRHAEQCFYSRGLDGFNAPNDRTVYIRAGNRVFRLDLMIDCIGLAFRDHVGLESIPGDPWICQPIEAQVVYRENGVPTRCPVSAIHQLSPDELAALPPRDRP
jgi:hypothetical protein